MHKNIPDAVRYWEAGIVANPGFTSNYYWLAKYYASTSERVWAVMYGEMFISLERNTERTMEISELIAKVYKTAIKWPPSDTIQMEFTKSLVSDSKSGVTLPFEQVFQQCAQKAADSLERTGADSLGYEELCKFRNLFIYYWYLQGLSSAYPVALFDWIHEFPDPSYIESYHRWLFLKGNEDAFQSWYYTKPEIYNGFVSWFKKHPLKISRETYFSRSKF
jgi:hypothetical protein